jgi:two-component system sensor histidine kinase HydH
MKPPFPLRYFLASILLLAGLVTLFSLSTALRTQQELRRQLEEKGEALAEALDISSRNAILSNALMEETIAQRLLDNARLVDQLLLSRPPDREWLQRLSAANGLARIDLLDRRGHPYEPPPRPPMMPGMMMARPPATAAEAQDRHAMMMYMWGRRWAPPSAESEAPPAVRDRKFWEGTVLGVAVAARSFPGIIAVHADAHSVLDFSRTIGVQHQVEELGRQGGVDSIALLDHDLTVLAHSDPARVGQRETDEALRAALENRRMLARMVQRDASNTVYEVAKPLALEGGRTGLLRIGLSTATMDRVWRRDRLVAVLMAVVVLGLGALGMATIFFIQNRHLTEIKALESEMARGERLATVGNLAAAVAHEIRNPLSAVSMGLQRLRAEFEPAEREEYRRMVDLVQGEVRRLNAIVEEFLSLARPIQLRPEAVAVAGLLDEIRRLVEPQAGPAGIVVEETIPAGLPPVRADRDRIKQVLLNLVLNALEAMPSGGRVTLGAAASDRALTFTVADSGSGISPELLPRVFEPYVTTKTKGLGLGLAIARRIVEAHGGRIEAESGAQGTCFRVTLPQDGAAGG